MSKIKIMLSSSMKGKTKEKIDTEKDEMANLLLDYYGDDNCEVISSVVENHEQKSDLKFLSDSILVMSMSDVLAMGYDWENSRSCKLEHTIAKAYHREIVYLEDLKKGVQS